MPAAIAADELDFALASASHRQRRYRSHRQTRSTTSARKKAAAHDPARGRTMRGLLRWSQSVSILPDEKSRREEVAERKASELQRVGDEKEEQASDADYPATFKVKWGTAFSACREKGRGKKRYPGHSVPSCAMRRKH